MKIKQILNANFITATKESYQSKKTGKEEYLYKITLMIGGNACTLPCTEDVYNKTLDMSVMEDVQLLSEYNVTYKSYRIVDLA